VSVCTATATATATATGAAQLLQAPCPLPQLDQLSHHHPQVTGPVTLQSPSGHPPVTGPVTLQSWVQSTQDDGGGRTNSCCFHCCCCCRSRSHCLSRPAPLPGSGVDPATAAIMGNATFITGEGCLRGEEGVCMYVCVCGGGVSERGVGGG